MGKMRRTKGKGIEEAGQSFGKGERRENGEERREKKAGPLEGWKYLRVRL